MIVLGKDKVDERYNISDDGTITDLQGVKQHLRYSNGRKYFKKVPIYRIQMYTKLGYRNGKFWDIHHKDENKLNDHINNLVYISHSAHTAYHNKNKIGTHLSQEVKIKISNWTKQNNIGKIWINNGVINKFVDPNNIPEGFVKGMKKKCLR